MIPALAMDTVCCSITSWSVDRAPSDILSNSSMQHTPRSRQHQRARLQHHVARLRVPRHVRGETHGGRTPTAGVDAARRHFVDVRQELGLDTPGSPTRITLMSPLNFIIRRPAERLVRRAEQLAQEPAFHLLHLPDGRREGRYQTLVHVLAFADRLELGDAFGGELHLRRRTRGATGPDDPTASPQRAPAAPTPSASYAA